MNSISSFKEIIDYQVDFGQRIILFFDTLRQRANNMFEHEQRNLPHLLKFKYEKVLDGRDFEVPSNYALLKILEVDDNCLEDCLNPQKPPVIIFDPRAGHGPGIGGFKRDSEVGIALSEGHPVYFAVFYPEPIPHQTIAHVLFACRQFVEKVKGWHKQPPILYGNCQAGWLIALLSSHSPGLMGPIIMNGSPLSYWASGKESNPLQILGGIIGGVWLTRFLSDINHGKFDGAWLVQNFENLNLANSLWKKYSDLFQNIDQDQERFLEFERWWNGFYSFSEEEITSVVENLFIGDKLERGEFALCENCTVNLKDIKNPILIFASHGDNITPPRQALHWIRTVYPDTQSLKDAGQRIVYLINPHVGHLGIFVSAKVVHFEHHAIFEHIAKLNDLKPGLYQMKILKSSIDKDPFKNEYKVEFHEKDVTDLCEIEPVDAFRAVRDISEVNDHFYRKFIRPWIELSFALLPPHLMKTMHPMRLSRKIFSEKVNPFMGAVAYGAKQTKAFRHPASETNPFKQLENEISEQMTDILKDFQVMRDSLMESFFKFVYHPRDNS